MLPGSLPLHDGSSRNELTYCFCQVARLLRPGGIWTVPIQELAIAAEVGAGDLVPFRRWAAAARAQALLAACYAPLGWTPSFATMISTMS
jgi:hypothetical protein